MPLVLELVCGTGKDLLPFLHSFSIRPFVQATQLYGIAASPLGICPHYLNTNLPEIACGKLVLLEWAGGTGIVPECLAGVRAPLLQTISIIENQQPQTSTHIWPWSKCSDGGLVYDH